MFTLQATLPSVQFQTHKLEVRLPHALISWVECLCERSPGRQLDAKVANVLDDNRQCCQPTTEENQQTRTPFLKQAHFECSSTSLWDSRNSARCVLMRTLSTHPRHNFSNEPGIKPRCLAHDSVANTPWGQDPPCNVGDKPFNNLHIAFWRYCASHRLARSGSNWFSFLSRVSISQAADLSYLLRADSHCLAGCHCNSLARTGVFSLSSLPKTRRQQSL